MTIAARHRLASGLHAGPAVVRSPGLWRALRGGRPTDQAPMAHRTVGGGRRRGHLFLAPDAVILETVRIGTIAEEPMVCTTLSAAGEPIRTFGSMMRLAPPTARPRVTTPDPDVEWRLSKPPPYSSIGPRGQQLHR